MSTYRLLGRARTVAAGTGPLRVVVVAMIALLALFGAAGPALAHNTLVSSDPAKGARLDSAPSTITLTFDQAMQDADVNQIALTAPDGAQVPVGQPRIERNVLSASIPALTAAGEYIIGFRILSADGHPVTDEIRFTLTTAAASSSSAPQSQSSPATTQPPTSAPVAPQADNGGDSSSGLPVWVWVVGAAVLLAVGVTVALRMGRTSGDKQE
ncbi:copper resistance CopC family protein [Saccharomonospora sp. NPDC046836]|uniref:copper resistance CopC family protein n=1 Tax=Saccharomonospora sp. NPDC046836 TaxID=3156921 RepID=UPI0033F5ECF2